MLRKRIADEHRGTAPVVTTALALDLIVVRASPFCHGYHKPTLPVGAYRLGHLNVFEGPTAGFV
jgi:hypothetical protein